VFDHIPSSITPALSHFWISRRMRGSATRQEKALHNFRVQSSEVSLWCGPEVVADVKGRELMPEQVGGDQIRGHAAGQGLPIAVHAK
jgi:hypothetical protein